MKNQNKIIKWWISGVIIWFCLTLTINNYFILKVMITHVEAKNLTEAQISSEKPISVEDTVLEMVREAGLNPYEAWAIINCESRWKADAIGVNTNGTYDRGLWQINSIHKDINNTDAMNYVKATKWAITKRLNDGHWGAWTCNKNI